MKLKSKPSERAKKRYLLIQGQKEDIEKSILDYLGILGYAKANPIFVNRKTDKTILSINRKEIDNVRASFEVSNPRIKVLRVSGTLKGLNIK